MNFQATALSVAICLALAALAGCSEPPPASTQAPLPEAATSTRPDPAPVIKKVVEAPVAPHVQFFKRLGALCGNAYAGYLTVGTEESDRAFGEAEMTMHVRDCSDDEIRIPFAVGDNRSRTWVVRRVDDGLSLHHRHVDQTGAADEPDGYGGLTAKPGKAGRQEFVVDAATVEKLPETKFNVWALEVNPGKTFAYELQRPEEERFFRVEFDLDQTINTPPPAWGETG